MSFIIDSDRNIWQRNEPPIDFLYIPYQLIKPLITEACNGPRARSDCKTKRTKSILREIDEGATKAAQRTVGGAYVRQRTGMPGT